MYFIFYFIVNSVLNNSLNVIFSIRSSPTHKRVNPRPVLEGHVPPPPPPPPQFFFCNVIIIKSAITCAGNGKKCANGVRQTSGNTAQVTYIVLHSSASSKPISGCNGHDGAYASDATGHPTLPVL